jgi:hypothetical protein
MYLNDSIVTMEILTTQFIQMNDFAV